MKTNFKALQGDYDSSPRKAKRTGLTGFRLRLRQFIENEGVSQADFAAAIGETPQSLGRLLHTDRRLSPKTAVLIEKVTGRKAELWLKEYNEEAVQRLREMKYVPSQGQLPMILSDKKNSKRLKALLAQGAGQFRVSVEFEIPSIVARAVIAHAQEAV
jgi:plasmid maintenance system antidote protein VapI